MMSSKDDNKPKYADDAEKDAEEVLPKKQKTIDDYNGDSFSSTDDYSLESEEEEINLPAALKMSF
jgi:hypothetical protein